MTIQGIEAVCIIPALLRMGQRSYPPLQGRHVRLASASDLQAVGSEGAAQPLHLHSFFNNVERSDVILSFSGRYIHANRAILSQWSPYFDALLNGSWAEAGALRVELREDDPDALERLLRWIYGGDMTVSLFSDRAPPGNYLEALEMFVLDFTVADKYLVTACMEELLRHFAERQNVVVGHIKDMVAEKAAVEKFINFINCGITPTEPGFVAVLISECERWIRKYDRSLQMRLWRERLRPRGTDGRAERPRADAVAAPSSSRGPMTRRTKTGRVTKTKS